VAAVFLCVRYLEDTHARVKARVDVPGMVTFTLAAAFSAYWLIDANEHGWGRAQSWGSAILAAVMLVAFVVIERRTAQPMLDLQLMRNRSFVGILLAATLLTVAAFAAFTYTSIWLQSVVGLSPIQAGLTGLPLSGAAFVVSGAIGRFLHHTKPGPIIAGGLLLIGVGGLIGASLVHGDASWPELIPGFIVIGIGVGLATPTLSSAAMAAVPPQRGGMAAGAVNTGRQLGFAFGIAVLGSVFSAKAASVLSDRGVPSSSGAAKALAGGQAKGLLHAAPAAARGRLDDALHAASVSAMQLAFLVAGIVGVVAAVIVFVMVRTPNAATASPRAEQAPVAA
jgi:hypothetical protein